MSVDYRLLSHFEASQRRLEAARRALPEHWRNDPRPEAQVMNDHWVRVLARATELEEGFTARSAAAPPVLSLEDR